MGSTALTSSWPFKSMLLYILPLIHAGPTTPCDGRLHRGIASRGGADKQGLRPVRTPTHTFPPVAMERWSPPDQDSWVYRVRRTPRTARDLIGLVYCIRPKNFPFPVFYSRNRFPCMPDSVISTPVPSATGFDLPSGACLIPESYRPLRF